MLRLLLPAALALGTVVPAPPAPTGPTLLCETDLSAIGDRRIAWVDMIVDEHHRRLSSSLFMRTNDFEAQWAYDGKALTGPETMEAFQSQLELPSTTRHPVTVKILLDGKVAGEEVFPTSLPNATVFRDGHIEWSQSITLTQAVVPNIFGHKLFAAKATGADGATLAETQIALPDWSWVERETREAERKSDSMRRRRRCGPGDYLLPPGVKP